MECARGLFTQAYLRLTGSNKIASFHEIFVKNGGGRGKGGEGDMPKPSERVPIVIGGDNLSLDFKFRLEFTIVWCDACS